MAPDNKEETGTDESPVVTSDSVALTPEQRDEQTIARLLGTETQDTTPATKPDSESDGSDAPTDGEDGATDSDTTEVEADEKEEDDADEDELPEVTDEELESILDALDERLLAHPRIQKVLDERAKADADRRYEERRKAESVGQESERLIRQGRTAVENVYGLFNKLNDNLDKAAKGEDVDESVKFNRDDLISELGAFGAAAVAEAYVSADSAFTAAFTEGAKLGGKFTDEEVEVVKATVQTAQRILNDPKQGRAESYAHLLTETTKFLVDRAKKAGKAEAEAAFLKKRDALKKVVGGNETKAAIAKIANARKKLPAGPAATPAVATTGRADIDAYRAAKAAGDYAKADEIAQQMAAG